MEPENTQDNPPLSAETKNGPDLLSRSGQSRHVENNHPVFVVDDTFFRSRIPKATHWSIAWADLMMTMFVLFLTLFVYQLAHREFLSKETPEVIAGAAIPVPAQPSTSLPFYPINPVISAEQANPLIKTKPVTVDNVDIDGLFKEKDTTATEQPLPRQQLPQETEEAPPDKAQADVASSVPPVPEPAAPSEKEAQKTTDKGLIAQMYDLSKVTVASEKLEKFASVELIPDKTMRIILTGDLLFDSGRAQLTKKARESLRKLLPVIEQTPYMINVIGHTDSVPMHSEKFSSNWELSTARAGQVAQFLIEEGHIPARQFVVSGYSYYRPVKPNTTAANRKANRRVEIILSKEPPPAQPVSETNIQ